ncbi:MAG: type II secretion system protein GspD [Verrucomicrobiales bacterium]
MRNIFKRLFGRNNLAHGLSFFLITFLLISFARETAAQQRRQGGQGNRGGGGGGAVGGGRALGGGAAGDRQYYSNGTVGEAMITSDPETRRIIVITDDETSQYVSQVVTNLDQPKPQVLIKVVFLEVTYRNSLDIGLEGGTAQSLGGDTSLTASNLFGLGAQGAGGTPGAGLYTVGGRNWQATLRAIAEAGQTEILSRPSILARNNQQATITVGQTLPFITNTRITDTGQTINTVQYSDIGIILRVTPFITSDNLVEMIVSPEISSLTDQTVPISTGVSAPVIAKRAADTVVVTPDGSPVLIGGLMQNTKTQADSKIPFLGDIPYLGNLFKRRARGDTKTELMIFMTPHIVTQPSTLTRLTDQETGKTVLAPNAFPEAELNRFLDNLPIKGAPEAEKYKKKKGR